MAPAAGDELPCQPVEQFGMRRPVALQAEIVFRGDQALAEIGLPDAIDRHARRQRMVAARPASGQNRAGRAAAPRDQRRQHGRHAGLHRGAGLQKVAADVNVRFARLGPLAHHERGRDGV